MRASMVWGFFALKNSRPNCDANSWQDVPREDTISLRHLPRRSSKNCDLQFANSDRLKANYCVNANTCSSITFTLVVQTIDTNQVYITHYSIHYNRNICPVYYNIILDRRHSHSSLGGAKEFDNMKLCSRISQKTTEDDISTTG